MHKTLEVFNQRELNYKSIWPIGAHRFARATRTQILIFANILAPRPRDAAKRRPISTKHHSLPPPAAHRLKMKMTSGRQLPLPSHDRSFHLGITDSDTETTATSKYDSVAGGTPPALDDDRRQRDYKTPQSERNRGPFVGGRGTPRQYCKSAPIVVSMLLDLIESQVPPLQNLTNGLSTRSQREIQALLRVISRAFNNYKHGASETNRATVRAGLECYTTGTLVRMLHYYFSNLRTPLFVATPKFCQLAVMNDFLPSLTYREDHAQVINELTRICRSMHSHQVILLSLLMQKLNLWITKHVAYRVSPNSKKASEDVLLEATVFIAKLFAKCVIYIPKHLEFTLVTRGVDVRDAQKLMRTPLPALTRCTHDSEDSDNESIYSATRYLAKQRAIDRSRKISQNLSKASRNSLSTHARHANTIGPNPAQPLRGQHSSSSNDSAPNEKAFTAPKAGDKASLDQDGSSASEPSDDNDNPLRLGAHSVVAKNSWHVANIQDEETTRISMTPEKLEKMKISWIDMHTPDTDHKVRVRAIRGGGERSASTPSPHRVQLQVTPPTRGNGNHRYSMKTATGKSRQGPDMVKSIMVLLLSTVSSEFWHKQVIEVLTVKRERRRRRRRRHRRRRGRQRGQKSSKSPSFASPASGGVSDGSDTERSTALHLHQR